MTWLFWSRVVLFIFIIIIFLILQFDLLYPSMITSLTFPFISVPISTNNNTTSLAIHKSCCSDMNTTPRLAYLISGSAGDGEMLRRILEAIYHPNNFYIVQVDQDVSFEENSDLFSYINSHAVFSTIGNVKMIDEPYVVFEKGSTKIASVLHAAAVSLKEGGKWDWFINLDASSYPLVTQDDLLYVLSKMPRHLNFIHHIRLFPEDSRSELMVADQGLYMSRGGVTALAEKRDVPTGFRIFIGSSLMALTHSFVEYCIRAWDNFPRTLLMYHTNSVSPAQTYFQTVICNSLEFSETTVNTDLHFTALDDLYIPRYIDDDLKPMVWKSNAPFARMFDDSISEDMLDFIDAKLLFRGPGMLVPGGWCAGTNNSDRCMRVGDVTKLQPGRGATRLRRFVDHQCQKQVIIHNGSVSSAQCKRRVIIHNGL